MQINTNLLSWHKDLNKFTAEASTLRWSFDVPREFDLISAKTGTIVRVTLASVDRDERENETQAWNYRPINGDTWVVTVFND